MSYIDLFDHEHVGFFAGLPVYRALQDYTVDCTNSGEFSCRKSNLVLGGGYLEYPGMVVRDLDFVASVFILDWIDFCEENECSDFSEQEVEQWSEVAHDYVFGKDEFKLLECIHWSMRDYSDFYSACQSGAMLSPFIESEQRNEFETWLASNLGELVVFSYPDLILDGRLKEIASKVDRYLYGNIQILPAGYPSDHLGTKHDANGVISGVRAWMVERCNK